jgi:hypothetical protein
MDVGATSPALVMASHVLQMLMYGQLVESRNMRQVFIEGAFLATGSFKPPATETGLNGQTAFLPLISLQLIGLPWRKSSMAALKVSEI